MPLKDLIKQIAKFGIIGVINTGIDFVIFNVLISLTNFSSGLELAGVNLISFVIATINSYFLNKYWTFQDKRKEHKSQFIQFVLISAIGAAINTGIVGLFTAYTVPLFDLSDQLWANVAKLLATGVSLVWNFFGYKFIVFQKKKKTSNSQEGTLTK